MKRGLQGQYQLVRLPGESYRRFLPAPLPPDPPLQISGRLEQLRDEATGRQRKRLYCYTRLVKALEAGAEPF